MQHPMQLNDSEKREILNQLRVAISTGQPVRHGTVLLGVKNGAVTVSLNGDSRTNLFTDALRKLSHANPNDALGQHVAGMANWVGRVKGALEKAAQAQTQEAQTVN